MNVYKVCTKKESQNGKKSWPEIGVIFDNGDGKLSGYLNNNPNQTIYLFKQEARQNGQQSAPQGQMSQGQGQPGIQFADQNTQNAMNAFDGQPVNNPF